MSCSQGLLVQVIDVVITFWHRRKRATICLQQMALCLSQLYFSKNRSHAICKLILWRTGNSQGTAGIELGSPAEKNGLHNQQLKAIFNPSLQHFFHLTSLSSLSSNHSLSSSFSTISSRLKPIQKLQSILPILFNFIVLKSRHFT